ncbi:hypothetical protein DYB31_014550, partial [Aphanomyces astaci]
TEGGAALSQPNQTQWIVDHGQRTVQNVATGKCLDAFQNRDAGVVHVLDCSDDNVNQKWVYDAATSQLRHATHVGYCLDVCATNSTARGGFHLSECHDETDANIANQQFDLVGAAVQSAVPKGHYNCSTVPMRVNEDAGAAATDEERDGLIRSAALSSKSTGGAPSNAPNIAVVNCRSRALERSMGSYLVYNEVKGAEAGEVVGHSLVNALVVIGFVTGLTFFMALLYKFNCMRILVGYIMFSSSAILGFVGGQLVDTVNDTYLQWPIDWVSFLFIMVNFSFVGVVAIFYQKVHLVEIH